ncbi:MAG: ABC transporter permease [Bacteroidetes bacterium]|nr:ABC transporter permease [Bacteroidota bacterium]
MNFETFIAKKILKGKSGNGRLANPVITVATGGIALGVVVMIVSVMVVTGFRKEITNKVTGFGAHIRINNFDSNNSYEEVPISNKALFISRLQKNPEISHVQQYATKAGIIKTSEEIQGVVLKGVSSDYNWNFSQIK